MSIFKQKKITEPSFSSNPQEPKSILLLFCHNFFIIFLLFKILMKVVKYIDVEHSNSVLNSFAITLAIYQITIILSFGIFVRMHITPPTDLLDNERPVSLLSINFMLLLGFGFLMTVIRTYWLSSFVYPLLVMVMTLQLYILIQYFWAQIFQLFQLDFYIFID